MPQIVTWRRIEYRQFSVSAVLFVISAKAGIHAVNAPPNFAMPARIKNTRKVLSRHALCYNCGRTMRLKVIVRSIGAVVALTAVVALIAPLAGPVFDHHFAERQPDHLHFGAPGEHSHAFESAYHIHRHPSSPSEDGTLPIVLYKSDGGIAATLVASPVDVDASLIRQFQPTSVFTLPPPLVSAARQHTPVPLDKPPASIRQHPAGFPVHQLDAA